LGCGLHARHERRQVRSANDGGSNLVIPEQSKNKEAAWAFVEFMLGRYDSQVKQFEMFDLFPTLESTFTDQHPNLQSPDGDLRFERFAFVDYFYRFLAPFH
jgi:ABC-type glycerol-3-phosphate transport system substrate-binding protein